jgi:hypothetical protein
MWRTISVTRLRRRFRSTGVVTGVTGEQLLQRSEAMDVVRAVEMEEQSRVPQQLLDPAMVRSADIRSASSRSTSGLPRHYRGTVSQSIVASVVATPVAVGSEPMPRFETATRPVPLAVGEHAPDFRLRHTFPTTVSLSETLAGGPVLLAFYVFDFGHY